MKYCGIDLHSNNSVVVITDETDRVATTGSGHYATTGSGLAFCLFRVDRAIDAFGAKSKT